MQKFGIGQAVRRREDERFLTGCGRYIDDIDLDGVLHAAFVRSPHAHARILSIDTSDAETLPDVLRIYTFKDVRAAGLGSFPSLTEIDGLDENGVRLPPRHALTGDVARFVGDPVTMIVANTRQAARDAAELVVVDYEDLPAIVDLRQVLDRKAPLIWKKFKSNRCYHFHKGDEAATDQAIADAYHVTSLELVNNRVAPSAIEPRGAIGDFDAAADQYVLHISGQGVFGQRAQMADVIFKVPHDKIRVVMPDVGGGFGAKNFVYPENVMVMLAARELGRPVKWIADRSENFQSEIHGRDHLTKADLALDANGKFTALKVRTIANMGAYLSSYATIIPTSASWVALGGNYTIPNMSMSVDAVFTNCVPVDAYRGAGRPEAAYLIERIVDVAAAELGIEPLELRRRNFIREFPYTTALGRVIDCGDFAGTLNLATRNSGWNAFEERRAEAAARGRLLGRGVASYLEVTLGMPNDEAELRFDEDGAATLIVGSMATGQGHETTYMQLLHAELGLSEEDIRFVQGDTSKMQAGGGHGGSRSLSIVGNAILKAAAAIREKGLVAAAHILEARPADMEFRDGLFAVKASNRQIGVLELEQALREDSDLPQDIPRTLSTKSRYDREAFSYPNGAHIAEVEVDPETGAFSLQRYTVVDDFGRIINPAIAAGQVAGGAAQGIGQAMLEGVIYDEYGQLLTGSYMDYALPRADDLPAIDITFNQNAPTTTNPLGVKGAGEAGATGAPPAIINAVMDALKGHGVRHLDMPLTPQRIWRAIHSRQ